LKEIEKSKSLKISILLSIGIGIVAFVLFLIGFGSWIELKTVDYRFRIRGEFDPALERIGIVFMGDESIEALGKWPWRRLYHAALINTLSKIHPKSIIFDVLFTEPSYDYPQDDKFLEDVSIEADNVYLPYYFVIEENGSQKERPPTEKQINPFLDAILEKNAITAKIEKERLNLFLRAQDIEIPITPLALASKGIGFANVKPDSDGLTRRAPLLVHYNGRLYPSLSLLVACDFLDVRKEKIRIIPGKKIILPSESLGRDIRIPIDGNGQMWINYRGGIRCFKGISYKDVLKAAGVERGKIPTDKQKEDIRKVEKRLEEFSEKLIFIGMTATGSVDLRATPYSSLYPMVGLLANVVDNIIEEKFIRETGFLVNIIIFFSIAIILGLILPGLKPLWGGIFVMGILALFILTSILLFRYLLLINPVIYPTGEIVFIYLAITVYREVTEEKEKKWIKSVFQRYVTTQVVEEILSDPAKLALGGTRKRLTVLFADIRNFTGLSERLSPEVVVEILNEFLSVMTDVIFKYRGTLDKFIGDAIMAFFGAPLEQTNHEELAVRTALQMQEEMKQLQKRWRDRGFKEIGIGIGINTGEMIVGNIGSSKLTNYTVIGDHVNLASRLQEIASGNEVIISQETYEAIRDKILVSEKFHTTVKGKEKAVCFYKVLGNQ